ncbi:hypothetical protein DESC_940085 [Desulfosarcina cetonica]|nr:hypothetical protein DESC_940085 [Desulfosarcina cetonica]
MHEHVPPKKEMGSCEQTKTGENRPFMYSSNGGHDLGRRRSFQFRAARLGCHAHPNPGDALYD